MSGSGRPRWHLTPPVGWMNDPVGVLHHRGRYHLFYQHHPHSTAWDVACAWGHATGADLVRWRHLPPALEPGDGDDGCWSGSAVVRDGRPVIAYTSVSRESPAVGRVRFAEAADPEDPELRAWRKQPWPDVEEPQGVRVAHLRDPFVWRDDGRWRMLLGAGLQGGTPAVLAYSSPDLLAWSYDGVLVDGRSLPGDADLGQMWECPQLLDVDGVPVFVVSVWRDHVLVGVVAAVAAWDGGALDVTSFRPLVVGAGAYAATTFRDARGRPCSMAWLRTNPTRPTGEVDEGATASGWAGVLTLPVVLSADAGRVHAAPHPDVDALVGPVLHDGSLAPGVEIASAHGCVDLRFISPEEPRDVVLVGDDADVVLQVDRDGVRLPDGHVVRGASGEGVRVLTDLGVVEVFTADGGWGAVRAPGLRVVRVVGDVLATVRSIHVPG